MALVKQMTEELCQNEYLEEVLNKLFTPQIVGECNSQCRLFQPQNDSLKNGPSSHVKGDKDEKNT